MSPMVKSSVIQFRTIRDVVTLSEMSNLVSYIDFTNPNQANQYSSHVGNVAFSQTHIGGFGGDREALWRPKSQHGFRRRKENQRIAGRGCQNRTEVSANSGSFGRGTIAILIASRLAV